MLSRLRPITLKHKGILKTASYANTVLCAKSVRLPACLLTQRNVPYINNSRSDFGRKCIRALSTAAGSGSVDKVDDVKNDDTKKISTKRSIIGWYVDHMEKLERLADEKEEKWKKMKIPRYWFWGVVFAGIAAGSWHYCQYASPYDSTSQNGLVEGCLWATTIIFGGLNIPFITVGGFWVRIVWFLGLVPLSGAFIAGSGACICIPVYLLGAACKERKFARQQDVIYAK